MALKRIIPPASYPVTLDEMKKHLREVDSDNDALISALIGAATDHAEWFMGRRLVEQTWDLIIDEFPLYEIKIPLPPLIEVVSVTYDDPAGDETTLSTDYYTVDNVSEPGWIVSSGTWPTTFDGINAVRVRFKAGYVTGNSPSENEVPEAIRAAIKLIVGTMFNNRETIVVGTIVTQLPWAAEQLLRAYRIEMSMA